MFYKIGHRGAAGHAPENTIKSFKKALALGADMIELDVHICQTGEPVVIHNKDTKRLNKKKGLIKNIDYSELKKLKIPKLENVLNIINGKARVNIELKGRDTAAPVSEIIKKYIQKKNWKNSDFLISSFDKKLLKETHACFPEIRKALLVGPLRPYSLWLKRFPFIFKQHLKFAKEINSYSIHLHRKLINKKIIAMAQKEKLKIFIYTVNKEKEISHLKTLGIDGIFSDYPDRL